MPQVLGWFYFSMLSGIVYPGNSLAAAYATLPNQSYIERDVFFFLWLISTAAFGYSFNDLCDVETDKTAGKPNSLAKFPLPWRIVIVAIPFLIGLVAWYKLNQNLVHSQRTDLANLFIGTQFLALILYSIKPFRMKERAELGAVFDAFYGHLNPVLITFCVFGLNPSSGIWFYLFITLVIIICFIKGIRNILLHQIEDRKKDNSAKINSVVLKYGPWRTINFVNNFLFPAEVFFLVCLTIVMSIHIPPCIIPLIFFGIISYLKLSGWKLGYADRRLVEFKFTYFMNDYYEVWLPVFMLIILSVYRHEFVFLLILHLIFFPMFGIKLVKDFKAIRENFKTEEDY